MEKHAIRPPVAPTSVGATPRSRPDGSAGFTLIELVVTMTIVSILAAVAIPSYLDQVRRGHRATAQALMLDVAVRQRQMLIDRRAYAVSLADLGVVVPADVTARYAVEVVAPADAVPPTFRISATPAGAQVRDRCGTLSLDQAGTRAPAGCW